MPLYWLLWAASSPSVVASKLHAEAPSAPTFWGPCKSLQYFKIVNDGKVLWPAGVHEKVLILYSDATPYMLKACFVLLRFTLPAWLVDCCVAKEVTAHSLKSIN
jgi:hypothetical protein